MTIIICANPLAQYLSYQPEIDTAIKRVLLKGRYILGEEVNLFEEEFATYLGTRYAIGVGSGTDAISIAISACDIGPGDEVITVSHTAVATVAAIEIAGAIPVLVDIEPDYFTIDHARVEAAITPKTRAVIAVHLYGQPANLEALVEMTRKHNLLLIEDCAQAHGARYHSRRVGSWGDIACFSFYPTKNLGAIGDGGMIVTNNSQLAEKTRLLRQYGWNKHHISNFPGYNSRLDELQAAILRVKLHHLDDDNAARRKLASIYDAALSTGSVIIPSQRSDSEHVYHLYVIRSPRRNDLKAFLEAHGVGALIHYPLPVHVQPAYQGRLPVRSSFIETEQVAGEILSLPIYPELTEVDQQTVISAVLAFDKI